jgi:hypothetical protein
VIRRNLQRSLKAAFALEGRAALTRKTPGCMNDDRMIICIDIRLLIDGARIAEARLHENKRAVSETTCVFGKCKQVRD